MSNAQTVAKLCADVGVEIVEKTSELAPGQVCSTETLYQLYKAHG